MVLFFGLGKLHRDVVSYDFLINQWSDLNILPLEIYQCSGTLMSNKTYDRYIRFPEVAKIPKKCIAQTGHFLKRVYLWVPKNSKLKIFHSYLKE